MKKTSIATNYFYSFYKRTMASRRIKKGRMISDRSKLLKLQSIIWKTVAEHYIENEGGVYLDNFGYLCHIINPKKNFSINHLIGEVRNIHTGGYKYRHTALDFPFFRRYYHLEIENSVKRKSRDRKYKFLYREVLAKRHIEKDFRIFKIFKKGELLCRSKNF